MGRPKPASPTKPIKRKRKEKDPNAPKRPTSAYFYFVADARKKNEKAGIKISKVAQWTKEISEKWRELTDEDKVVFNKQAAKDKARYTEQMAIFKGTDVNKPKRPMSSYFLWLGDFRIANKGKYAENKDLLRGAGENWKKLTNTEKKPYEVKAEAERAKYEAAMKEYHQKGGNPNQKGAKKQKVVAAAAAPPPAAKNGNTDDDDDDEEEEEEEEGEDEEEDESEEEDE